MSAASTPPTEKKGGLDCSFYTSRVERHPASFPHRTRRRSDGRHWHPHCIGRNAVGSPLRRGSAAEGGRNSVLDGDYIGTQDFVTFEDVEAIASNGLGLLCRVSDKEVWVPYANMARRERTVRRPGDRGRLIVPHWLAVNLELLERAA